ncbi:MAG TPA: PIG-L deacetylase family protein [Candidatus Saccharimonadia bacterium]|nr:PIG-L deacetylase family protein [Candidatus Saccharimonadia bacterium]
MKKLAFTPQIVLAVVPHADDTDCFAGGTLARWAEAGAEIYLRVLTDGSRGGAAQQRQDEQRQAAALLGVKDVFFSDFEDGALADSLDVRREIVRDIRRLAPDTVVAWDPKFIDSDEYGYLGHPDHLAAAWAAHAAVGLYARNRPSFPELLAEKGLQPHTVPRLVLMTLGPEANFVSDVSDQQEAKIAAIRAHASQQDTGVEAWVRRWSTAIGHQHGMEYAELFRVIEVKI